ncbi:hypothetical protein FRC04_010865 [Tulasnella sp. 424]|nr:hypothetical protein FRC04_010865 [Tulasnella sp. 424]
MPPKRGAMGPQRGGPRGAGPPARGGRGAFPSPAGRGGAPSASSSTAGAPSAPRVVPGSHIVSIGVKRPSYGSSGKITTVITNQFELTSECPKIYHYDGLRSVFQSFRIAFCVAFIDHFPTPSSSFAAVGNEEKPTPKPLMFELYQKLKQMHPEIFGSLAFDGRKNLYSSTYLPFPNDRAEYQVQLQEGNSASGKAPKVYRVRFQKTHQEIIPEVLNRFVLGQSSQDNDVTVAINSLNVVLSMFPSENPRYASNARSFFVPDGKKALGLGVTLWNGYFQSVRPTAGKMVVNIDVSTGMMYTPGPLMDICLEVLKKPRGAYHALEYLHENDRKALSKYLNRLKIHTTHNPEMTFKARTLKEVLPTNSIETTFKTEGKTMTVKQYYEETYRKSLNYPKIPCVRLLSGASLPMEICNVFEGQLRARSQPPPELTKEVVEFATKKPGDRLAAIKRSLDALGYGQSPYLRAFQLQVKNEPSRVEARVLPPPTLIYGGKKQLPLTLGAGQWDMAPNKFFVNANVVSGWAVLVCSRQQWWPPAKVNAVAQAFAKGCTDCGIGGMNTQPTIEWADPSSDMKAALERVGATHARKFNKVPSLLVCILPMNGAATIYRGIKHFGDVQHGVATQCMLENKCWDRKSEGPARPSYYANIALKVNAKLGGVNVVASPKDTGNLLGDPNNPVMILGADAIHPPPESQGRPSFTAVVGSLDMHASKYVASCRPQTSKQEIIDDMEEMTKEVLMDYLGYRKQAEGKEGGPKKMIWFRDGVSEGQFQQVIDHEIPKIRGEFPDPLALKIDAKITFVVVGKRHHVRFFPESQSGSDRTGNCLAGTVVEQGVSHPVEFDYYLQSHAGLLGTSRPAHYNVLVDENNLQPDALQQLTYTLCHIYARSTRSVSIPAPTYYADIVCSRSANHYDPKGPFHPDSYEANSSGTKRLEDAKQYFKNVHPTTRRRMYFS